MQMENFGTVDYVIFFITISISTGIGIYFGCFGSKQRTATEYLFGNKRMKAIPIGLSLYSGAISGITVVGAPAEAYVFGTQIVMTSIGALCSLFITWNLILPVFCGALEISTPYEYYERRFNNKVRLMSSFISVFSALLLLPVVLYASALTVSSATGYSMILCSVLIGGSCVFYTTLGGFQSVIWTDTIQASLMLFSYIFFMKLGIDKAGGISEVWHQSDIGKRLQFFNMDPNPFQRMTFWSAFLGMSISFVSHCGCSAVALQRYLSLESEKHARVASLIGAAGYGLMTIVGTLMGLTIYTLYRDCDPISNQDIKSPNQLLSFFIANISRNMSGFSGLFIAGVLSAGLSTISAEINTASGLIYNDFVKKIVKHEISEIRGAMIMKILVLIIGIFHIAVSPLLHGSKYLTQIAMSLTGVCYGSKVGMILLGTSFPKANSIGVIIGPIISICITGWLTFGSLYYNVGKLYVLPVSTSNCSTISNITEAYNTTTMSNLGVVLPEEPFILYKLAFFYYPVVGLLITLSVGLAVSYATGPTDINKIDPLLLIPYFRRKHRMDIIQMLPIVDVYKDSIKNI